MLFLSIFSLVCADLDEGSFLNNAKYIPQWNIELGTDRLLGKDEDRKVTWYGCDMKFYAKRDIHPGEEIRANYADFAEPHAWKILGL